MIGLRKKRWQGCEKCGFYAYTKTCWCPNCGFSLGAMFPNPSTDKSWSLVVKTIWKGQDPNESPPKIDDAEGEWLTVSFADTYTSDERGA